jgi:hypothetical protein
VREFGARIPAQFLVYAKRHDNGELQGSKENIPQKIKARQGLEGRRSRCESNGAGRVPRNPGKPLAYKSAALLFFKKFNQKIIDFSRILCKIHVGLKWRHYSILHR